MTTNKTLPKTGKHIYRFTFDCGRMGTLMGLFVADARVINEAIGRKVYFGEVLGKHSEIFGELTSDQFEVHSSDPNFMEKFERLGCSSGYNPLDYLSEGV